MLAFCQEHQGGQPLYRWWRKQKRPKGHSSLSCGLIFMYIIHKLHGWIIYFREDMHASPLWWHCKACQTGKWQVHFNDSLVIALPPKRLIMGGVQLLSMWTSTSRISLKFHHGTLLPLCSMSCFDETSTLHFPVWEGLSISVVEM